jgi:hypothetical protein
MKMKLLRFAGLGIVIWGLSLLWPQVNQVLTPTVMMGMILGLGATTLAYVLIQRVNHHDHHNSIPVQDQPSRPVPMTLVR